MNIKNLWDQAVNNPKTSKDGLKGFVLALASTVGLVVYSLISHKPLDVAQTTAYLGVVFAVLFQFVKLLLASDSNSSVVRIASKLIPEAEVDNIAKSVAKTAADTVGQVVEEVEKPKAK
jgi:Na+-translocating ferredoxin:NAD+ oxidoreductase RnfA subunit